MAEFIGYVGTLHEISSENATVALKDVKSYGTEGRKPGEEVAPNSTVYEFIVFKGSDVKDLRIEEAPKEPEPVQSQIPDDPAILESTRKTTPGGNAPQPTHSAGPQSGQNQPGQPPFPPPGPNQRQHFPQMPYPPYGFSPHDPRFGPQGFPPGPPPPGYPQMPYGGPQWYPPPGPGRFYPGQHPGPHPGQHPGQPPMPIGPPGQPHKSPAQPPPGAPTGPAVTNKKGNQGPGQPGKPNASTPVGAGPRGPVPPADTKPGLEAALAPPAPVQDQLDGQAASGANKSRIVPAVPLPNAAKSAASANGMATAATVAAQGAAAGTAQTMAAKLTQSARAPVPGQGQAKKSLEDANRDARAAVEQAMAKLASGKNATPNTAIDNAARQMQNMQLVTTDGQGGRRPSQTRGRGNRHREQTRKIEVPKDDFDFESSNAKFNKQDLVREAIATGSPVASPVDGASPSELPATSSAVVAASYNKSSSFFDNISSEIKERAEGTAEQVGGREFRNEERRKNMETFGQGSVDSGYRHRGRGRGRGGYRGRGRGRGGGANIRGGQGTVATES